MGQIIGGAAKPKRCNLNQLSQVPTPAAGEYILVSSDNSMNAAGQGNFDCYIVGDGSTTATALKLIKTYANDMDDEPTAGSDNLVKSGGVIESINKKCLYANIKEIFSIDGYVDQHGEFHTASTIACTDYIDISTFYGVEYSLYVGSNTVVAVYDSSKVFIDCVDYVNNSVNNRFSAFSQFENAKYIRLSCKKDYLDKAAIRFVISQDSQLKADTQIAGLRANAKDIFTLSGFIRETDGQEISSSEFACTDFIDISSFSGVEYSLYVGNRTITALYDTNKAYLGEVNCVNESVNNRFVSFSQFENAKYIRFSCKKDYLDNVAIRFIISKDTANNLTNKLNFSNFGYYKYDGTYYTSSASKMTGFVDIANLYAILVTARGNFSAVSLFDSNKQFVESILSLSGGAVYEQVIYLNQYKTRGKYIRVCSQSERNSPAFSDYNVTLISLSDKLVADTLNPPQAGLRYLSAYNYGAVGDGVTDDTEALEELFADAFAQNKAVYIPSGTYLIRRSLTLRTGMEVLETAQTL